MLKSSNITSQITKSYSGKRAVDDISFTVESGEILKSVCLCTDEPAFLAEVFRDRFCVEARGKGEGGDGDGVDGFHK